MLKITTTETTFSPVKSTAESQHAHTSNELKKQGSAASKVQLEAQHAQGQHNGHQHRALLQSKLLEPAVVKSVHTCRRILLSFPFCSTCKRFIGLYSTPPTPSSPGFKRMNWAQLLSSSFFFFLLSSIFQSCKQKKIEAPCYRFIDDVRVRVCAELGLKDSFIFFLRLNV